MIFDWVFATEGEREISSANESAVAGSEIAPRLDQHRHHFIPERHRREFGRSV